MTYTEQNISGVRIGLAPLEDFAYPVAGVLLLPALWLLLAGLQEGAASSPGARGAEEGSGRAHEAVWASRPLSWAARWPTRSRRPAADRWAAVVAGAGHRVFLVPYNLAMHGINDVFDDESDLRNPRKGGLEGAVVDRAAQRPVLWRLPAAGAVVLALAGWAWPRELGVYSRCWRCPCSPVVAYVVGPRFKECPFLDAMTSATHFVSPAVYGLTLAVRQSLPDCWLLPAGFFLRAWPRRCSGRCRTWSRTARAGWAPWRPCWVPDRRCGSPRG
ncbi:hypothetical protein QJS66_11790 [Kocuria rhizophila]|nr:hypothetical protein QJS66_11790 [Kocuria rhizophila]